MARGDFLDYRFYFTGFFTFFMVEKLQIFEFTIYELQQRCEIIEAKKKVFNYSNWLNYFMNNPEPLAIFFSIFAKATHSC